MNISIPTQIITPNEPSSARPSTGYTSKHFHPQSLTVPCRAVKVHTKIFYTQTLLHMVPFTQTHFDTQTL